MANQDLVEARDRVQSQLNAMGQNRPQQLNRFGKIGLWLTTNITTIGALNFAALKGLEALGAKIDPKIVIENLQHNVFAAGAEGLLVFATMAALTYSHKGPERVVNGIQTWRKNRWDERRSKLADKLEIAQKRVNTRTWEYPWDVVGEQYAGVRRTRTAPNGDTPINPALRQWGVEITALADAPKKKKAYVFMRMGVTNMGDLRDKLASGDQKAKSKFHNAMRSILNS